MKSLARKLLEKYNKVSCKKISENGSKMLMHPISGYVQSEKEWIKEFEDANWEDDYSEDNFDSLIEVVPNIKGKPDYDDEYGEWRSVYPQRYS